MNYLVTFFVLDFLFPIAVIHEGECPFIESGDVGVCVDTCSHDGDCQESQKCCSNGCGHSCVETVSRGMLFFAQYLPGALSF